MPSALVVGAEGSIGRSLLAQLCAGGWEALGTTRHAGARGGLLHLDLAEPRAGRAPDERLGELLASGPVVFLLAAATGYERCEQDPTGTWRINVERTVELASDLVQKGAFVVFPSSSAVFGRAGADGAPDETSAPAPETEYGRQKAVAEQAIAALVRHAPEGAGAAIVRIAKVVDASGHLGRWMRDLTQGTAVDATPDVTLAPVSMAYVGQGLQRLAERRSGGIYHLSGEREISYYEFACLLAVALDRDPGLVRAVEARAPVLAASRLQLGEATLRAGLEPQALDEVATDLVREFRKWNG